MPHHNQAIRDRLADYFSVMQISDSTADSIYHDNFSNINIHGPNFIVIKRVCLASDENQNMS